MPELQQPLFLLLILPLIILFIVALRRKIPTLMFSNTEAIKKAGATHFSYRRNAPLFLVFIATLLFIVALTGPRKGIDKIKQRTDGIDIMLAIDVSGSMEAIDIPAQYDTSEKLSAAYNSGALKNRMEVAKKELENFVSKRPSDRIGLIAFAGQPFTVCPPTLDHSFLTGHLQMLKAGMFSQTAGGTGLASPIAIAVNSLKKSDAKRRVMVLFTDGSNNVDAAITPLQAAKMASDYKITIYTVGIGSGRVIRKSPFGQPSVQNDQEFDEELMKEIAKNCSGLYLRANDQDDFVEVMNQINTLEKTTIIQSQFTNYNDLFTPLVLAGLILLLLAFLLQNTLSLQIP